MRWVCGGRGYGQCDERCDGQPKKVSAAVAEAEGGVAGDAVGDALDDSVREVSETGLVGQWELQKVRWWVLQWALGGALRLAAL